MKKLINWILLFLIGLVVSLLAGCGSAETDGKNNDKNTSGENKKTLRVVTNAAYAPMEYLEGNKIVGFDIDFVNAVAEEAGYKVKIEHVGWDPLFIEVEGKSADFGVGAITINDERKQSYDFSVPYYLSTIKILVPEDSNIASAKDIKGKVVAVQNGTTGMDAAENILGKGSPNVKKFEDNNLAIQELLNGGADAVLADNTIVEEYAKNNPDKKLKVVSDDSFASEFYGLLFPKESKLKDDFDKAINAIFDNGKYTEIYQKWFGIKPDIDKLKEQQ